MAGERLILDAPQRVEANKDADKYQERKVSRLWKAFQNAAGDPDQVIDGDDYGIPDEIPIDQGQHAENQGNQNEHETDP